MISLSYITVYDHKSLGDNTPVETQNGLSIKLYRYTHNYKEQKSYDEFTFLIVYVFLRVVC